MMRLASSGPATVSLPVSVAWTCRVIVSRWMSVESVSMTWHVIVACVVVVRGGVNVGKGGRRRGLCTCLSSYVVRVAYHVLKTII